MQSGRFFLPSGILLYPKIRKIMKDGYTGRKLFHPKLPCYYKLSKKYYYDLLSYLGRGVGLHIHV